MGVKYSLVVLMLAAWALPIYAFDTTFDTHQQRRGWKFHGNFTYANSTQSEEVRHVRSGGGRVLSASPPSGEFERMGIWLIKHDPNGSNVWNMSYSMTHLLFAQAWVTLLAHPSVPIVFRSSGGQEVGRFWSDGKGWCDAVFNVGLHNTFTVDVHTPKEGEYALIDKVVLGIMGNITALKNKTIEKPCLTVPFTKTSTPPDMLDKAETDADNEVTRRVVDDPPPPPDMVNKQQHPPLMSHTPPPTNNATSMRTYQTERGGAKCDCVCTCAKPPTTTTTTLPPTGG